MNLHFRLKTVLKTTYREGKSCKCSLSVQICVPWTSHINLLLCACQQLGLRFNWNSINDHINQVKWLIKAFNLISCSCTEALKNIKSPERIFWRWEPAEHFGSVFLLWNVIASEINVMPNTTHKLSMNYSKPSATQLELKKGIWGTLGVFVLPFILRPQFFFFFFFFTRAYC